MLECKYVNGMGDTFIFGTQNNRINKSDIRDYEWQYTEQYDKIKQFTKKLTTRSIPVRFFNRAGEDSEVYDRAEDLYAITDRDVRTLTPGRLYIGDYCIEAYVVASAKQEYDNGVIISETLSILSDFRWRKEVVKTFGGSTPYEPSDEVRDYPKDYMWDYIASHSQRRIITNSIAPYDFKIVFQGPVVNPTLIVGGNIYRVYTEIYTGEYLTADSVQKTIIRTKINGEKVNEFSYRDRDNYIFEKMPVRNGSSLVQWQEGKIVELTAFVERSEPKWT